MAPLDVLEYKSRGSGCRDRSGETMKHMLRHPASNVPPSFRTTASAPCAAAVVTTTIFCRCTHFSSSECNPAKRTIDIADRDRDFYGHSRCRCPPCPHVKQHKHGASDCPPFVPVHALSAFVPCPVLNKRVRVDDETPRNNSCTSIGTFDKFILPRVLATTFVHRFGPKINKAKAVTNRSSIGIPKFPIR